MNISAEPGGPRLLRSTPRSLSESSPGSPDVTERSPSCSRPVVFYINHESTPEELQKWLQHKGFSKRVCKVLQGRSAEELFRVSGRTLEKLLGREAGNRLHSLLTVARNLSGYTLGRSQELAAILKVRKEQTEVDGGTQDGGSTRRSNENNADCTDCNNTYDVIPETKVSNVS